MKDFITFVILAVYYAWPVLLAILAVAAVLVFLGYLIGRAVVS